MPNSINITQPTITSPGGAVRKAAFQISMQTAIPGLGTANIGGWIKNTNTQEMSTDGFTCTPVQANLWNVTINYPQSWANINLTITMEVDPPDGSARISTTCTPFSGMPAPTSASKCAAQATEAP